MRFKISVPATSANVGPGFDVMGLAFDMYNRFTFDTDCPERLRIEGCLPEFSAPENNLLYTTLTQVLAQHGRLAPNLCITKLEFILPSSLRTLPFSSVTHSLSGSRFLSSA